MPLTEFDVLDRGACWDSDLSSPLLGEDFVTGGLEEGKEGSSRNTIGGQAAADPETGMSHQDIYAAKKPGCTRGCSLLKTLYTNHCSNDCYYCINTGLKRGLRHSYTPDTLSRRFMLMFGKGMVEGLFLSSGIIGDVDRTMEEMLEAVERIRYGYGFAGYIHLKILPGTSRYYIDRAAEVSDRISMNIEVPSSSHMDEISGTKDFKNDILSPLKYISEAVDRYRVPGGFTSQFIVEAAHETDREILDAVHSLYDKGMRRTYFSAFVPVRGTKLEHRAPGRRWRQLRLYQADFLIRNYGYSEKDLDTVFDEHGFLNNADPKTSAASRVFDSPADINECDYPTLIKIPGIGPKTGKRIIDARNQGKIIERPRELRDKGAVLKRALPFLKIGGRVQSQLNDFN